MKQDPDPMGKVLAIWRYPVKSMGGEELAEGSVTESGLLGDRAYALADAGTTTIASAKLPRKWARLLHHRAAFDPAPTPGSPLPGVRIAMPDGSVLTPGQDDVDAVLSNALDRPVTLTGIRPESPSVERLDPLTDEEPVADIGALMMAGRFSDYAAVHLLTTATLERMRELYPEGRFDVRRFRPNVVVQTAEGQAGFVENSWVGRTLAIGEEVRLRVTDPTPRCSIPTLAQGDLPRDPEILRTLVVHNRVPIPVLEGEALPSAGVYAFVVRGGHIRRGDPVRAE